MQRKTVIAASFASVLACFALVGSALVGVPTFAQTAKKVKAVIPQNSVFVLNWIGANEAGVFRKHGIDLEVDVRPFAAFLAGLPAKETMATTYSGMESIEKMNQGVDWAVIGGGLTLFHGVFVPKDSPIKTVEDLRGKRVGVWSTGAGVFKGIQTALIDAHGIDIVKDTKIVQLAPPALFKLLERGDVDAMINISSFTMRAYSQPDKFRSLFNPNDYWKKKTGYPIVWTAPLVAWKSWVEEDRTRARNYAAAVMDSFRWLRKPENLDAAVKAHGKMAGVTSPAVVATYKKWLADEGLFLAEWDEKSVDAQWQFLELAKRHAVLEKVPPKDEHALILTK
jgi:NitT/TauT family transport system substrate-binding protein